MFSHLCTLQLKLISLPIDLIEHVILHRGGLYGASFAYEAVERGTEMSEAGDIGMIACREDGEQVRYLAA